MRTKNELYQQALRTVAMRRQTARALAQDAQAEAEAAIPGLRHAEEEVRVRGIRCAIDALRMHWSQSLPTSGVRTPARWTAAPAIVCAG